MQASLHEWRYGCEEQASGTVKSSHRVDRVCFTGDPKGSYLEPALVMRDDSDTNPYIL